ncbi:MAG: ATP-binding protein [Oscillospiraceae bacterium]|nr:ATP-binding protein [Oscillospiraceae bacterium]
MFVGRENELQELNELYEKNSFQFLVIYGRRRVGKTALINEFAIGKNTIYFTGIETNSKQNLENLSKAIFQYTDGSPIAPVFQGFQQALEYVFELSCEKRLILVIDEYPYVAKSYKSFASTLQTIIDKYKGLSKLFLILCGSSMSFMEEQVLGYKSPLYGRRTAQFKIQPFDYFDSCRCFKSFSPFDMALIYGIAGGIPQYLLQIDDTLSIEENIKNAFLKNTSYLFEEPSNLLKQEMREPAIYNAIITAIATGSTRMSEISSKAGEETSACAIYLKNLLSIGVVKKEAPVTEKSSKKTIYSIADNMFRFWYRFIPANMSIIQNGMVGLAYERISDQLSSYMGAVFEEICKQYLWRLNREKKASIAFVELGRWWGNDPVNKSAVEIDILAIADKDNAIFGECKWTNEDVGLSVLDTLVQNSRLLHFSQKHYYLFAKNGFTSSCIKRATELGNVVLVSYSDIAQIAQHHRGTTQG